MLLLPLLLDAALANSGGKTGSSTTGCGVCHGAAASSATTVTFSAADTVAAPGERLNISLVVSHASLTGAGLNVSASSGTLGAGSNTRVSAREVTHSSTQAMAGGSVTFNFTWTAPTAEGTYTLYGAGNAVDRDRADDNDDKWNLASNLTLTVDDGCDDTDRDGYEACDDGTGDDCDDSDATVNPAATEVWYDDVDQDCDGEDDDQDGDGYDFPADCDDVDATIHPAATESCDTVDNDCDGSVDESGPATWYRDADGDGYGATTGTLLTVCSPPSGYLADDSDCDDTRAAVHPAASEACNGLDDNCDGSTDGADAVDPATWYADADGDGFGDVSSTRLACAAPAAHVADATDCDDTRSTVRPDGAEVCDALDLDEDCDGAADDDDAGVSGGTGWYADVDGDGYGDAAAMTTACTAPVDHVAVPGDCADTDADYNPAAVESCDDPIDYNCDGLTGYDDSDGDGVAACEDCDDGDPAAFPGATERCNTVDDDCDGTVDEDDAADAALWYLDADSDGFGTAGTTTHACAQPAGYDDDALDCDDTAGDVRPDAPEVWYDGVDQDCDGADDDQDGDGFLVAVDCDDTRADVNPGATEAWYDGLDANCVGDSDYDADIDGQDSAAHGGTDCDDADPAVYLGAPDTPYDGVVTDCVDADEFDQDGDGHAVDVDCDDARSDVHPGAAEVWYDGVDQDCDANDTDQDGDGVAVDTDCDDEDATVTECDTGGDTADTGDTGVPDTGDTDEQGIGDPPATEEDDKTDEGCGCGTGVAGGWGLVALASIAAGRRRRFSA